MQQHHRPTLTMRVARLVTGDGREGLMMPADPVLRGWLTPRVRGAPPSSTSC